MVGKPAVIFGSANNNAKKQRSMPLLFYMLMKGGRSINSQEYWRNREEEALKHYIKDEKEYSKEIERIYRNMLDQCQKEIESYYAKYASKENISLAEAKKRISQHDVKAFERKAARYVKDKDFSAKANEELRLYNATMRINRLEMLKANIGLELISGSDELDKFMGEILKGRTEEELKRQAGILGKTVKNNAQKAHAIVNGSFHSGTFSDRIWQYQDLMREELGALLQTGLIQGKNPRALTKDLKKYFTGKDGTGGMRYCMERLMRTELARVQTEAQKQSYLEDDIEEYEFIVNGGCCPVCMALKGKRFKVSKMMPGENAPPMHPHCRCSTAPYFDRKEFDALLNHIDKGGTTEEWEKLKAQNINKPVTNKGAKSDIMKLPDIPIGRSIGAKALNYEVIDPASGEYFRFAEGTRIHDSEVFAGSGVKKPLNEEVIEGLTKEFGGDPTKWQHAKGIGTLDYHGEEIVAEVHWFQEESVGKVKFKVKEWLE